MAQLLAARRGGGRAPPLFARAQSAPPPGGGMWRASLVAFTGVLLVVIVAASAGLLGDGGGGGSSLRRFSAQLAAATSYVSSASRRVPPPFTADSAELEGGALDFCPALTVLARQRAVEDAVAEVPPAASAFRLAPPAVDGEPGACPYWGALRYPGLLPADIPICLHDPATDGGVSAVIVERGGFMTRRQLGALLAAAPCSEAQPYFIDAGANVGSWGLLAAVAAGCHVLAFEPLAANVERLRASAAANNVSSRFTVFRNALGAAPASASIEVSWGNSGGNRLAPGPPPDGGADADGQQFAPIDVVTLDHLFARGPAAQPPRPRGDSAPDGAATYDGGARAQFEAWRASLPVPLTPSTVGGAKLDLEGHDAAGLHGGAHALGAAPLLFLEFEPRDVLAVSGCDPVLLLRRLWGEAAGYAPATVPHGGYAVVVDSWSGLPLPPPCEGTPTHAALGRLEAYAAAGGVGPDGGDAESGWPSEWDDLLVVRRGAPFLPALLGYLAAAGNHSWADVAAPLQACGEPLPGAWRKGAAAAAGGPLRRRA